MTTHVMLTRVGPGVVDRPEGYLSLWRKVRARIDAEVPGVRWPASFAVGGPVDYLDVLETEGDEAALKVAALVRSVAGAKVELWPATRWQRFKALVAPAPADDLVNEAGADSFPASDPPSFTRTTASRPA